MDGIFLICILIFIIAAIIDNITWKQIAKMVNRINTERIEQFLHGLGNDN